MDPRVRCAARVPMTTKRVTGPWHPPGTTPLEELTLVKRQLDRGRLPFTGEAIVCFALLVVECLADIARGRQPLLLNVALILASFVASTWLVCRYRRSRLEWLQAIEAWNRYKNRR